MRGTVPFQSHAGSIEAEGEREVHPADEKFQSHAGSIEAVVGRTAPSPRPWVSIPRWFD